MLNRIHTVTGNQYIDHPSEAIWSIYLSEAERHDNVLVVGWKSDMDAILIFVSCRILSR